MSNLAHGLGLAGEFANLAGATVLALDLFWRNRESEEQRKLMDLRDWAIRHNISGIYSGFRILDRRFVSAVLNSAATRLAYCGWLFLFIGFALLMAYHWLEMAPNAP